MKQNKIKNLLSIISQVIRSLYFRSVNNNSLITLGIILIAIFYVNYKMAFWEESLKIIGSDTASYYTYLPALFIYHDLDLDFYDKNEDKLVTKVYFRVLPDGQKVIQTTYGLSFLFSPFFFLAHFYSYLTDNIMDGYSPIYKIGLIASSIFYFGLGLILLRKILLKFYSQWVISLVLLVIGIGTNILHYVIVEPAMSHVYSFSLIILFIYFTIRWHKRPNFVNSLMIGLVGGFIILIRPTNILVILLFIFWNVHSIESAKRNLRLFLNKYYYILLIIILGLLVWVPQFFYWKEVVDQYFYFSYGDRAYFFLGSPEITNILFSYRKGWLLYTPLMTFALIGIFFMIRFNKQLFFPTLLFTFLNIYLLASWCFWWFGGSFGLRGFIDSYGIMAIPMGAFFTWTFRQIKFLRVFMILITFTLIYFNTFQVRQYYNVAIHWAHMTKEAYWETFLKLHRTKRFPSLLEPPPYDKVEKRILEAKGINKDNQEEE